MARSSPSATERSEFVADVPKMVKVRPQRATARPARILSSLMLAGLLSAPASALEFIDLNNGSILARGQVELNDAEKFRALVTTEFRQQHGIMRFPAIIYFDATGGSHIGALRLGAALRDSHVWTRVGKGAKCYGACAWAFMGADRRSVEGSFSIHPVPAGTSATAKAPMGGDSLQALSAATVAYAKEATGTEDLTTYALGPRPAGSTVLTDPQLVRLGVITEAVRPAQYGSPIFDCRVPKLPIVRRIICENPRMAAQDRQILERLTDLRKIAPDLVPVGEQERWLRYRDSCENDTSPNGNDGIRWCLMSAYDKRLEQLDSRLQHATTRKEAWRPIEPMCPKDGRPG